MFLFKSHKKISHRQSAVVGFVLALMSILSTAILAYAFPLLGAWLNSKGVFHLDIFLLLFGFTLFAGVQGLLLFGFPLYYAKDKKSHMTGFQILIYEMMWMLGMVVVLSIFTVALTSSAAPTYDFSDIDFEAYEEVAE